MPNKHSHINLPALVHETMIESGFVPDFPAAVEREVRALVNAKPTVSPGDSRQDLRQLLWSSIDDQKTRDLDQVEYAEKLPGGEVRLLVAIADVDELVPKGSAIDQHARANGTSVYTGVKTFPMLPEELSTDLTSLVAGEDRFAVVTEMILSADGTVQRTNFFRAVVRNHAKLAYEAIGDWLESKTAVPESVTGVAGLEAQIKLQAEIADQLGDFRKEHGALELGTIQAKPVMDEHGKVVEITTIEPSPSRDLIANFMIAANVAMAQFLESKGGPSLRRVVRTPKYWSRIVEIAAELGEQLPTTPDSRALAEFLVRRKLADPVRFPDLSLAVVKSLGPGEYAVQQAGESGAGHFGLAVQDYTHSTAPNRRYADLVTQRMVKAALAKAPAPYSLAELQEIAEHCTRRDSEARNVERKMRKVAAALLLSDRIGAEFQAIVTGVTEKGTFARTLAPPVDGRIMRGEHGLRVGEKVRVRLLATDPERGFIDFARA
jgi:ribonuclease R